MPSLRADSGVSRPRGAMHYVSNALFLLVHLAVFLVFVVPFSWKVVALAVGGYVLRMWGITAGFHRLLSHRAYKTSRLFQFVIAWIGTSSMQNGPLWWASWHRRHHRHSDTENDAHSPVQDGFWRSHAGWFLDGSHDDPDLSNVRDLAQYPELRWLERHKWTPIVTHALVCLAIAGWSGVVWGFVVSTLAVMHATMLINSLAHVWGSRRFETRDQSRNNPLLALITLGEGWHNNHHHFMSSARQGFMWWELDISYVSIRALAAIGVVWDVREVPTDKRTPRPMVGSVAGTRVRETPKDGILDITTPIDASTATLGSVALGPRPSFAPTALDSVLGTVAVPVRGAPMSSRAGAARRTRTRTVRTAKAGLPAVVPSVELKPSVSPVEERPALE